MENELRDLERTVEYRTDELEQAHKILESPPRRLVGC
jgi:hypothetical protein